MFSLLALEIRLREEKVGVSVTKAVQEVSDMVSNEMPFA